MLEKYYDVGRIVMDQYRDFAFIYDELMDDVDYDRWVEYIVVQGI